MPTVLHVTQPTGAGVGGYVHALCADQAGRGWDVTVACPDHGQLPGDLDAAGVTRQSWAASRCPDARTVGEMRRLREILDRAAPDVVHLHSSKAGLAGRLAVRAQLPTLFQPHGLSWLAGGRARSAASARWERYAARWTTLAVYVGEGEADLGLRRGLTGPSIVVRTGVDLDRFWPATATDRREARVRLGLPMTAPVVVCVGRITRHKGQDLLLEAWPSIRNTHPDAMLALVGDGPRLEAVRRRRIPGVVLPGNQTDPRPWYRAADVVAQPSRWEGLPLTLLEAMAMGRSVVATAIPGIVEVLPAGAGALVERTDPRALADAICRRLCRPDIADAEGMAGANYATSTLDIRHTHDRLATVTARLASVREQSGGPQRRVPDSSR